MSLLIQIYKIFKPKSAPPYYLNNSIFTLLCKPIRKLFTVSIIPFIPFTSIRLIGYKLCGFKIGKNVFIGMRCYLDDLCYNNIIIEDNCVISYGVFFASHGIDQKHNDIILRKGCYIGMRTTIIAPKDIEIGEGAIVGAGSLVNRSIAPKCIYAGNPAKFIKSLSKK